MTEGISLSSDFKQVLPQVSTSPQRRRGNTDQLGGRPRAGWLRGRPPRAPPQRAGITHPSGPSAAPSRTLAAPRGDPEQDAGSSARGELRRSSGPCACSALSARAAQSVSSLKNAGDVQRSRLKRGINITTFLWRTMNTR